MTTGGDTRKTFEVFDTVIFLSVTGTNSDDKFFSNQWFSKSAKREKLATTLGENFYKNRNHLCARCDGGALNSRIAFITLEAISEHLSLMIRFWYSDRSLRNQHLLCIIITSGLWRWLNTCLTCSMIFSVLVKTRQPHLCVQGHTGTSL